MYFSIGGVQVGITHNLHKRSYCLYELCAMKTLNNTGC